jgi:zinc protease
VRDLTPVRVRDVARHYLPHENVCVVTVGPKSKTKPAARPRVSLRSRTSTRPQRFDLDGLTLLVKPNPRLPLVSIRAQFLGGVLAESDTDAGITLASSQLLLKGTTHRAAAGIQSELENLGGSLQCSADAHRRILGAEVMRGDEATALDLLADLALHPTLPADGLALVKKHQLASIREEKEDPLTVALRRARSEIFAGKPFARTANGTEASVKSLDIPACRGALSRTFNRENGVITVYGDVDPKAVRDQIAASFHTLPHGKPAYDPRRTHTSRSKPGRWQEKLDKEQAVLVIGFRTVDLHHPVIPALQLIDEACSDMGSRLFNRIREELGLAYYVGAQSFNALSCGAFYFYVGTAPHQLDQAEAEMTTLIKELAENGLSPDELDRAHTTWKSSWLRSQQGNGPMADVTGWNELNGLGHDYFQRLPAIMAAVTPADIKAAARTYLHPKKAFTVRVTRR